MKKQLLAACAVAGFSVVALGAPAQAAPPPSAQMNHEAYWEAQGYGDCSKWEYGDGVMSTTLPSLPWGQQYTLLVLKAGSGESASDVIAWPEAGVEYMHTSGKALSHIIYCVDGYVS
jgi:hypothetical protein